MLWYEHGCLLIVPAEIMEMAEMIEMVEVVEMVGII